MKKIHLFLSLLASCGIILLSCQPDSQSPRELKTGMWLGQLQLREEAALPFQFTLSEEGEGYSMIIFNADEEIEVEEIERKGDSLFIKMPVFDSEFTLSIEENGELKGEWYEYTRGIDYRIPFLAKQGDFPRFAAEKEAEQISKLYSVTFSPNLEGEAVAIGEFSQLNEKVIGTFQTETGDYRYLEGIMDGNKLKLSAFDGSHAFLFIAELRGDSISGNFWSGSHWLETWIGKADPEASLRSPDELTYLKDGYTSFEFKFPNLEGDSVSFTDPLFQDKVSIIQIMGSWCPNCMDETRLYAKWYEKYQKQGLEIVGIAFERTSKGMPQAIKNIQRMSKRLGATYPFLIAATNNDKSVASEKFPMLNKIISFPTSIFVDKKGRVRKIHTGFNGPGTGDIYTRYVEDYEAFIEKMLDE
ncbi:MAG: TlpA disulfide reductase family protein [Bacteroidota bacterium]